MKIEICCFKRKLHLILILLRDFHRNSILNFMFQARNIGDINLALTTGAQVQVAAFDMDNDDIAARFNLIENAINAIATPDCT